MEISPVDALLLAFKHLNGFSLPGVGTFHRTRQYAVVDHLNQKLLSPEEKFLMVAGESMLSPTEVFFFHHFRSSMEQAQAFVQELGAYVVAVLERGESMAIPGFGEIRKEKERGIYFQAISGPMGQEGDFFGLPELQYTLGGKQNTAPNQQEKQEKSPEKKAQPPQEKKSTTQVIGAERMEDWKRKKNRNTRLLRVVMILLLLVGTATIFAFIYREPIRNWWYGKGTPLISQPTDSLLTSNPPAQDSLLESIPPKDSAPEVPILVDSPKTDPKPPTPNEIPPPPMTANQGVAIQKGHHYLIIGSSKTYEGAQGILATTQGLSGAKPIVLQPGAGTALFRVAAISGPSKDPIIQKMVDWKTQFPDSWILSY